MIDRKLLRRLIGSYKSAPDPQAWLVAADHYEECGMSATAQLWRDRGRLYPAVVGLFEEVALLKPGGRKEVPIGTVVLSAYRIRNNVAMLVLLPDRCQVHGYRWATNAIDQRRYTTRRALELIDAHWFRMKGD